MAKSAEQRREDRQQWERNFRASHGVSSGTYYQMRRNAKDAGIGPKAFDKIAQTRGYTEAKTAVSIAKDQNAAANDGLSLADFFDDYYPEIDFEPDDFHYH